MLSGGGEYGTAGTGVFKCEELNPALVDARDQSVIYVDHGPVEQL